MAKEGDKIGYHPQLKLDILSNLQQLYLKQGEYLQAFTIKQERFSLKQQYGLRAFIGPGRIEPRRLVEVGEQVLLRGENQGTVAPEIRASGRMQDVERLMERIGRTDSRLIVIHGQSGVGKSSLVNGGLVPALQEKIIGTQDVVPVVVRVYTDWLGELLRGLEVGTRRRGDAETRRHEAGGEISDSQFPIPSSQTTNNQQPTTNNQQQITILEQLRECEEHNLRVVLIFDQFEEFFFVYPNPGERRQFFEFLGECLQILSLKIILSLREDYLHLLLECNRLPGMGMMGNDILSKNVLYPLGNFSPADAHSIIERLTAGSQFQLEPALIEALVADLAGEMGEVRPIELQVVGAQLQTEQITTLAKYRQKGTKLDLVKRYLAEVVDDCGAENRQLAELVLYLLTDEKNTRPLKTRGELARELQGLGVKVTAASRKLDLVLEILVASGLVFLVQENPENRYQLVHDYLAAFIRRQQEPRLNQLKAELEQERKYRQKAELQQQLTQEELARAEESRRLLAEANRKAKRRVLISGVVLGATFVVSGLVLWQAEVRRQEAIKVTKLERDGASALRQFRPQAQLEALLAAVKVGKELKALMGEPEPPLEKYPAVSPLWVLQTILNDIHERNRFDTNQGKVNSVSISPDEQYLATAGEDGTTSLWDLSGQNLTQFNSHQGEVYSVNFSSDGQYLATAGEDGTTSLWEMSGQKLLVQFLTNQGKVYSVSFSPNGQYLATAGEDGTTGLWNLSGQQLTQFNSHLGKVFSVNFSPDGKSLATTGEDGTARLWNLSGKQLAQFQGHQGPVFSLSFSPDGKILATTGEDSTLRLWNLSGNKLAQWKSSPDWVYSVNFSPDGEQLATGGADGTARLWDLSGQQLAQFNAHQNWIYSTQFTPDGKNLVTTGLDGTLRLWDLPRPNNPRNPLLELQAHQGEVWQVSFSPKGQQLATVGEDGKVRLWDLSGKQLAVLIKPQSLLRNVAFSPDGQHLATGGGDGTAQIWDLSGKQLVELNPHQPTINSISFSPDGRYLATAGKDGVAHIWNLSGKQLAKLTGHTESIWSISFSPDGQRLATAGKDGKVILWSLSGQQLKQFQTSQDGIFSINFSPDGERLVTAGRDTTIQLWNLFGKQLAKFNTHQGGVLSVSFSPDGQRLVTAGQDGTAKLLLLSGLQISQFKGHQGRIYSASFSPNGKYVATAGKDGVVRLWQVEGLDELLERGCNWLRYYLATNPNVKDSDRRVCDDIGNQ
ncbi:MAG: hypothetical protein F6K31_33335 [Symploca sp. SIO2G7]|nr:hypothetical protein [Symploca sp. SIO2G7]